MAINETLFVAIPAAALLLNLFLLLICLSARKNKLINAFMMLVISFVLWTGGSFTMRMMLYPGQQFWFRVSLVGIFLVPFAVYNFIYHYTDSRGSFSHTLVAVSWIAMALLGCTDLLLSSPVVIYEDGVRSFSYSMTPLVILPIVLAVATLALIGRLVYRGVRHKGLSLSTFAPIFYGSLIMFFGLIASLVIPGAASFPMDPLACGINALLLFYALYRKRLITFKMLTSRAPLYLSATVIMTFIMASAYDGFNKWYNRNLGSFMNAKPIIFAVLLSLTTILVYNLIRKLMYTLFNKSIASREEELRRFSRKINESLDDEQILSTFCGLIERVTDCDRVHVLMKSEDGSFVTRAATKALVTHGLTVRADSPIVSWLAENKTCITTKEFVRTGHWRAMWESDKELIRSNHIRLLLPLCESDHLLGFAMLAEREGRRNFTNAELAFLESAGSVMSIAARNAMMYSAMQREAYTDSLTGLYNRRYFNERAQKQFEQSRAHSFSIAIISMDDYSLFRELYGTTQVETALCDLGETLKSAIGDRGCLARHENNEFAISLPFHSPATVSGIIDIARSTFKTHVEHARSMGYPPFTFSCGICGYPCSAATLAETEKYAGIALYIAKKNGKNRTQIYSADTMGKSATPEAIKFDEQCSRVIYALTAAIDAKDHYTYQHSRNVADYAFNLAHAIGLDPEHAEIIRQAGLLHDIGKIAIPESILGKTGKLTDEEYAVMKGHPEASVSMIKYLPSLDYVVPAAFSHHERWDGKGYPRGLAGEDIPIGARCLCIADAYDAMTTSRSYRPAMSPSDALFEIRRNLGTQFDPKIGLVFIEMIEATLSPIQPASTVV